MINDKKALSLVENYIKRLRWSLSKLPAADRDEIIQEIHSHLLDRVEEAEDEAAIHQTLDEFGPPEEYARNFLENYEISVALASGSPWQIFIQNLRMLGPGIGSALTSMMIFILYLVSIGFLLAGSLKVFLPNNIGMWITTKPFDFLCCFSFNQDPTKEVLGYWIIPLALFAGLMLFRFTSNLSRHRLIAISEKQSLRLKYTFITILLILILLGIFVVSIQTTITQESGEYILEAGKTRLGILVIDDQGTATFEEDSNWVGFVIVKDGALNIEKDVYITGSVVAYQDDIILEEDATLRGNAILFAGDLILEQGATVYGDAILFAGSLWLEQGASVRDDAVLLAGSLHLAQETTIRGDATLFAGDIHGNGKDIIFRGNILATAGSVSLGPGAQVLGNALLFAGSMDLQSGAVIRGNVSLMAGDLDVQSDAVIRRNVAMFAGVVHLHPNAVVRGNIVLMEGSAVLDADALVRGKLLHNPDPQEAEVIIDKKAEVLEGVSSTKSVATKGGLRIGGFFLGILVTRYLLPLGLLAGVVYLLLYWKRLRKMAVQTVGVESEVEVETSPE